MIDGENRRVAKKVNGNISQGWIYRDGLKPIGEVDGFGKIVARFVYGSKSWVPDYVVRAAGTYRIISDSLGSPRVVVDAISGSVVETLEYDEFGNVLRDTNPGFQPFGFAGGIYDRDTALVRFGARDYDSRVGRWTSKDPIGFLAGDPNLYAYASNDPLNLIDPRGTTVQLCTREADVPGHEIHHLTHHWIRTGTKEAGLGPAGGGVPGVPGAPADSPYVSDTALNDHTGQGDIDGATCTDQLDEDEACVNAELALGKQEGKWTPTNQCWSVAEEILQKCKTNRIPPSPIQWILNKIFPQIGFLL